VSFEHIGTENELGWARGKKSLHGVVNAEAALA
jgi:hypothetical protein